MNTRKLLVSLLTSAFLLIGGLFAQNTATEATVTKVTGTATAKLPDGSTVAITEGMKLPKGAEITTGDASQVTVQAHEGIVAIANSKSTISIDELSVGANGMRNAAIGLKSGTLASALDPTKRSINNYAVRTPKGVAAARGTVYTVAYNGGTLSISVVNGVVESLSFAGVSLGNTTAGNVSSTTEAGGTTTVTLAQAIATEGTALTEALASVASAATLAGGTAEAVSVVTAIAAAAGNSPAATAIVAQSTAAAAATATLISGGDTGSAATIVSAAVTSAAQNGNAAAAGTIVATSTTTVSVAVSLTSGGGTAGNSVAAVAQALTTATNTAAASQGVNVSQSAVTTAATTAIQTAVASGNALGENLNFQTVSTATTPGTTQTAVEGSVVIPVITAPQSIDVGTISVSAPVTQ